MVGVGGLEPPTSRTRTVRATKLRHTPTVRKFIIATSGAVVNGTRGKEPFDARRACSDRF